MKTLTRKLGPQTQLRQTSQLYIILILMQSLSWITSIENHSFISF